MVLLEEFKDKARPDIRSHLEEQKVEKLQKAAVMADDYALTHKMSSKKRQGKSTENVGLVSKLERAFKANKLWTLWKTWPYNYKLLENRW